MVHDKQTPVKKLREYLEDPDALFILQRVEPGMRPTLCAAAERCRRIYSYNNLPRTIPPGFRIRAEPVPLGNCDGTRTVGVRRPLHYHPVCFELLCPEPLPSLVPRRLKLDGPEWGFMVRKWWRHRGAVDVQRIAEYVADFMAQDEAEGAEELPHPREVWKKSGHGGCVGDFVCAEPVQISAGQDIMYLRDLQPDRPPVPLSSLLEHTDVNELADEVWRKGRYIWHYFPEYDAEEGVVPETAIFRLQADSSGRAVREAAWVRAQLES